MAYSYIAEKLIKKLSALSDEFKEEADSAINAFLEEQGDSQTLYPEVVVDFVASNFTRALTDEEIDYISQTFIEITGFEYPEEEEIGKDSGEIMSYEDFIKPKGK